MKSGYPELSRHELPPSANPERHMSPDMAQMLEDQVNAGVIESPVETPSLALELDALDPEIKAEAESHLKDMGAPAVESEVEGPESREEPKTPEELKDERLAEIIRELEAEWEAEHGSMYRELTEKEIAKNKSIAKFWDKEWDGRTTRLTDSAMEFYFDAENGGARSVPRRAAEILATRFPEYKVEELTIDPEYVESGIGDIEKLLVEEAKKSEALPGTSGDDGDKGKIETAIATDEPDPEDKPASSVAAAHAAAARLKAEAVVDEVFASSSRLKMVNNFNKAKAEKEWRRDVREVNAAGVKQEVRDAKLNMKIAEQTYSRRGQRVLRKVARRQMREVINDRYAKGEIGWVTKQLSRKDVRAKARAGVEKDAARDLGKASEQLRTAEARKDDFYDKYGRRSNTLRKNYQRTRTRGATARSGSYGGSTELSAADYMTLRTETVKLEEERRKREAEEASRKRAAARPKRVVVRSSRPTKPVSDKASTVASGTFS